MTNKQKQLLATARAVFDVIGWPYAGNDDESQRVYYCPQRKLWRSIIKWKSEGTLLTSDQLATEWFVIRFIRDHLREKLWEEHNIRILPCGREFWSVERFDEHGGGVSHEQLEKNGVTGSGEHEWGCVDADEDGDACLYMKSYDEAIDQAARVVWLDGKVGG